MTSKKEYLRLGAVTHLRGDRYRCIFTSSFRSPKETYGWVVIARDEVDAIRQFRNEVERPDIEVLLGGGDDGNA